MNAKIKIGLINAVAFFLFLADRAIKYYFEKFPAREFFIFGDFFKLKLAHNPGIAFGIILPQILILVFYILIILFLVWFLVSAYQRRKFGQAFFLSLIIAGAFSNLFDRLGRGYVVDYFDLKYYSVFNLADAMIVIGVVGLIYLFRDQSKKLDRLFEKE